MHFLGKNIRYLRKRSSQKQDGIAMLVNKGQTTIGNWENGVSEPCLGDLLIISNYFGIPVDALLRTDLAQADSTLSAAGASLPVKGASPPAREPDGHPHPVEPLKYDHEPNELSMVREDPEDRLSPILEEIKTIRSEIERIKSRLPGAP